MVQRLDYIADMIQQLRALSADADCRTLASLLDLAHHEAMQQRRSCRRPASRRA
jgi:hypothetical protein